GGLHAFMARDKTRPLITDSGGFQVFSLAYGSVHEEVTQIKRAAVGSAHRSGTLVQRVSENGVEFRSYRDGSKMLLTPESSVAAQKQLGADIILPLDELPPYHIDDQALRESVARSHRWMARSLSSHLADPRQQAMYGIVHGGMDVGLRAESAAYLSQLPFDGFAVGGSMGKDRDDVAWILEKITPMLPEDKPRHVLGIADPKSLPRLAPLGYDTFDSCYPTRAGRHGTMLTAQGALRVVSGANKNKHVKPVPDCECATCSRHTMAYLHHLKKANEPLLASLLTVHNIHYMVKMMADIREKILRDEI
ncbi:queuine tRNA-ribosyltransferase, partial [Helicosporidium sp. ATCC 50920]